MRLPIAVAFSLCAFLGFTASAFANHWSGQLSRPVYANSEHGTRFWNHTGYTLSCSFRPVGNRSWCHGDQTCTTGAGVDGIYSDDTPMPSCPAYSLVARDESGYEWCIGEGQHDVTSYDHVDLWFFMNSPHEDFAHNSGYLNVRYDCYDVH